MEMWRIAQEKNKRILKSFKNQSFIPFLNPIQKFPLAEVL